MAINLEDIRWAENSVTETVEVKDEEGNVTGEVTVTNKSDPSSQFKDSGLLAKEALPRAYLNQILYNLYKAIEDLDTRISNLEP